VKGNKKGRRALNAAFALILAVALWLYVINVENPSGRAHLRDLKVIVQGQSQLEEKGLMVTAVSQKEVDLRVTGRKKTLMKLSAKNVSLLLDVSSIEEEGEWPLNCRTSFPANVNTDNVTLSDWEDLQVTVTVQRVEEKTVPIRGEFIGTTQTGYMTGEVVTEADSVVLTGPADVLEEIDYAQAQVGGDSVSEALREEASLVLVNTSGAAVDGRDITCSLNHVRVMVPVEKVSIVPLEVNIQDGTLSQDVFRWTIEPSYITVVEDPEKEVPESISLGTLDLGGIYNDTDCGLPIQLPEGIRGWNVPAYATVHLTTNRHSARLVPVEEITLVNVPKGYHIDQLTQELFVWVWGDVRQVTALEPDRLSAVVDLSQADRKDETIQRFPASVSIRGAYNNVDVLGSRYSVAVRLSK